MFRALKYRNFRLFGSVANLIGAQSTLILGGIFCLGGAAFFAKKLPVIRPIVRPIYKRLDIMPEIISVAKGDFGLNRNGKKI